MGGFLGLTLKPSSLRAIALIDGQNGCQVFRFVVSLRRTKSWRS